MGSATGFDSYLLRNRVGQLFPDHSSSENNSASSVPSTSVPTTVTYTFGTVSTDYDRLPSGTVVGISSQSPRALLSGHSIVYLMSCVFLYFSLLYYLISENPNRLLPAAYLSLDFGRFSATFGRGSHSCCLCDARFYLSSCLFAAETLLESRLSISYSPALPYWIEKPSIYAPFEFTSFI